MKITQYQQMMAYLMRPKFNGGGSVGGNFVKPKKKPEKEVKKRKKENFEKAKDALENPDEVKKMMDLADGGRIGFQKGSMPKGYINLAELGEKVGLPERIVTNPETGRKRALGGLRQRIIDVIGRKPSAERRNLKSKDFIDNVLVKQLDLKKVDLGQGQSTYIIKDPKAKQLDMLKEYFLRTGSKYGLTQETITNMKKFYNDPTLRKYIRKGQIVPEEVLKAKGIGINQAANVTFRLAQHLNGKDFANVNVDIPRNKSLGKKIFNQISKAPFGNPYQVKAYQNALSEITDELGPEYFEGSKSNMDLMKREARRILNREGVPTFDPTVKGSSGFNVNEIIGVKTGARITGMAPYSQFINIMEGKLNAEQYGNFVRQFEKFSNRMQTENKTDVIKDYNKYRKTFLKNNPSVKDIDVPKFSLQSPEKVYGKNRINKLIEEGLDLNKSYDDIGYTVDVGKKTRTLKEFITDPKNIARLKKFGKVGAGIAAGASLPSVVAADEPGAKEATSVLPTAAGAGAGAAAVGTKTGRSLLGKAFRAVGTPLAGAGFAGTNVYSKMKEGQSLADAVVDPITGLELSFPGLFKENLKKIIPERFQGRAARFGRGLLGLRGLPVGPIGLTLAAAGQAQDFYNQYQNLQRMKEQNPRAYSEFMSTRQAPELSSAEQTAIEDMGRSGAAGGGIAKLAGKSSGRPPESGPTPQGLDFLLKRGRKY
jgi:hypothetical protein